MSLCFTYVLMGLFGHSPWKPFDITTFGYMWSLAQGQTNFMNLSMAGPWNIAVKITAGGKSGNMKFAIDAK